MSYQVLARKWRPQNFKEMVGQQHVLQALSNALDEERLHHAYLFTGTRGVGKTTIARILVKCLNCETGITSTPCGECSSCKEIAEGRFVDLIEVDAASRTKVEDTRDLLENVHYAPTRGRFKVYLIDEVHMLSGHSFNALLKTLEEPPPHVKFLFATTDPQKLPVTILSRCLQFNLKRMPIDLITGHLETILKAEDVVFDEPSLRLLARGADGSMRDALSLMDQAIGYGGGALKENEVRDMLGTISHDWLYTIINAAIDGDGKKLLDTVEDMAGQVPDFEAAADGLISLLHQVAVQQAVPEIEQSDEYVTQLATKMAMEDVQLYYQVALNARRDLPLSPDPRAGFEMLLLRMMTFRPLGVDEIPELSSEAVVGQAEAKKKLINSGTSSEVIDNPVIQDDGKQDNEKELVKPKVPVIEKVTERLETEVYSENPAPVAHKSESAIAESAMPIEAEVQAPISDAPTANTEPSTTQVIPDETAHKSGEWDWHEVTATLQLKGMVAQLANHCLLEKYEDGTVHLLLDQEGEQLRTDTTESDLQQALAKFFNHPVTLKITATKVTTETPDKRHTRLSNERQQQAEQKILNDPFVKELQAELGA
ncbi:MAG TPA: DNA polymerase III subunit gamma/tau, partial [Thiothrix sp.]|nr:DNA polymerase III subunit gamma/tau [Thiothrix sp.]